MKKLDLSVLASWENPWCATMKTGYELHIYARTKAKVDDVIQRGCNFP